MSNKTINQALKDLYTGLGGDPQALADNSTCSDYIEDLESAIKGAASGAQIDDTTASETTVFSSAKTEDLINGIETLPSVAVGDIGEALIVESDGEGGAQWGKGAIPSAFTIIDGTSSGNSFTFSNGVTRKNVNDMCGANKPPVVIRDTTQGVYLFHLGAANSYRMFGGVVKRGDILFAVSCYYDTMSGASSSSASFEMVSIPTLPTVTASDNDKILKVVNGVWTAVTP